MAAGAATTRTRASAPHFGWSPTAEDFTRYQLSHVTNFWRQGRTAEFHLKAMPSGWAELRLTFELPSSSESIPPPINPAFFAPPRNLETPTLPQETGTGPKPPPPKVTSTQRNNYRRSFLHRATLAASSLPPPKNGSLRQAAQACVQRLQVVPDLPGSTQSANKRPLPASPSAHSPSLLPLAQRIRTDIHIAESETESPEREILRSPPCPENSPFPISPCAKGLPLPAPLIFTPVKTSCLNCEAEMAPDHQCEDTDNVTVPAYLGSLPLCHYCCHLGSGDYPVHYFMQCMYDDEDCSCKCYCSGAQLEHKHHVFPARFLNVKPMDPVEVPKAKVIVDKRTQRTRGYYPNCDSPSCVKYMKEDGLCLT